MDGCKKRKKRKLDMQQDKEPAVLHTDSAAGMDDAVDTNSLQNTSSQNSKLLSVDIIDVMTKENYWNDLSAQFDTEVDLESQMPYGKHVWRETNIGQALIMSLDELLEDECMQPEAAVSIVKIFCDVTTDLLPRFKSTTKLKMNGTIKEYRNFYGTWTFFCEDVRLVCHQSGNRPKTHCTSNLVRILASDSGALNNS